MDYKKAYALLVCTMSEAIDKIESSHFKTEDSEGVARMLKEGLERAEEMYISI